MLIHLELCKWLKFDHTYKWRRHKPNLSKKTRHTIFRDFEIQPSHSILIRRPYLGLINKKKKRRTSHPNGFAAQSDHRVKSKKNEKLDKYLYLTRGQKKLWNPKVVSRSWNPLKQSRCPIKSEWAECRFEEESKLFKLLKSVRIHGIVLETREDLLTFRL